MTAPKDLEFALWNCESRFFSILDELEKSSFVKRLWSKDATLWENTPQEIEQIENSLGWLKIASEMKEKTAGLKEFSEFIKREGYRDIVLLGMGGSSLAPLVLSKTFGHIKGYPHFHVLDSVDPWAVKKLENFIDPAKTLFIVSSKSGTTIEVTTLVEYFYSLVSKKIPTAGKNFIAITDRGSPLEKLSLKSKFLRTFINPSDIGGRFSALSYFGLVPAALMGIDVDRLVKSGADMAGLCKEKVRDNPGVLLGAALSACYLSGRDKVTFFTDDDISSFPLWLEQLIAESTGKEGKGLVPVTNEPLCARYKDDRVFVYCGKRVFTAPQGHPVIKVRIKDGYSMGAEFFRWMVATSVMGVMINLNPFDQPDVEESKKKTRALLKGIDKEPLHLPRVSMEGRGITLSFGSETSKRLGSGDILKEFFGIIKNSSYVAILAYLDPEDAVIAEALREIRNFFLDSFGVAATLGYGPRYLHSTGQLHKGGTEGGVFIIIAREKIVDVPIPGKSYGFFELELAQALGDLNTLDNKGRTVAFLNLRSPEAESFKEVKGIFSRGLSGF